MSLQRNDMLSTEVGGAPRARRSCYVNEPSYGFFIAGSSIKAMNGVYIRRNPPRSQHEEEDEEDGDKIMLYYEHMDGIGKPHTIWKMQLSEAPEEEQGYWARTRAERSEWVFVDPRGNDRFTHKGDTIVPGAGERWKHVHRESKGQGKKPAERRGLFGRSSQAIEKAEEDDENELPWQVIAVLDRDILSQLIGGAEYYQEKCDEAMKGRGVVDPPALTSLEGAFKAGAWVYTVVAVDGATVYGGASRTAEVLGRHAAGDYVRGTALSRDGKWLQLEAAARRARYSAHYHREEWVELLPTPEDGGAAVAALVRVSDADVTASRLEGEEREEAEAEAAQAPAKPSAASGSSSRPSLAGEALDKPFVPRLDDRPPPVLTPMPPPPPADAPAAAAAKPEAEKFFDAPESPAGAAVDPEDGSVFYDAQEEEPTPNAGADADVAAPEAAPEATPEAAPEPKPEPADVDQGEGEATALAAAAAEARGLGAAFPLGAAVLVRGLTGAESSKYNGASGVVVTSLSTESERQGVRLEAHGFEGKKLQVRPANLEAQLPPEMTDELDDDDLDAIDGDRQDDDEDDDAEKTTRRLERFARLLGLTLPDLGLAAAPAPAPAPAATAEAGAEAPPQTLRGFALSGDSPAHRLAAAQRCAERDGDADGEFVAAAVAALGKAMRAKGGGSQPLPAAGGAAGAAGGAPTSLIMAPDARVRNGALGARAAAAARAVAACASVREVHDGLGELKETLLDELDRCAADGLGAALAGESLDALRLRLTLVLAHLQKDGVRAASEAAREACDAHPNAAAASLLLARCLLRTGKRDDAIAQLERAVASAGGSDGAAADEAAAACEAEAEAEAAAEGAAVADGAEDDGSDARADARWAASLARPMLRAFKSAERRQVIALDWYERGNFREAAAAYSDALACLEAAAADDIHGRAAMHAHVAACCRRDKRPEAAVEACDRALALLPRFGRALFRRAACLLESGKPDGAVDAFERLYRVDRSWPRLSDWLVRAHAAARRMKDRAERAEAEAEEEEGSPTGRASARRKMPSFSSSAKAAEEPASPSTPSGGATPSSSGEAAEKLARESDHYVVLGVTIDATDKQIQQAYRMRSLKFHPDRKGGCTKAFQRIAQAFQTLSDADKRAAYDQGVDVKTRGRGGGSGSDSDSEEDEEQKQSLREEIERKYYPERYEFWPFGDPYIHKRKREERKRKQAGRRSWYDDDDD